MLLPVLPLGVSILDKLVAAPLVLQEVSDRRSTRLGHVREEPTLRAVVSDLLIGREADLGRRQCSVGVGVGVRAAALVVVMAVDTVASAVFPDGALRISFRFHDGGGGGGGDGGGSGGSISTGIGGSSGSGSCGGGGGDGGGGGITSGCYCWW